MSLTVYYHVYFTRLLFELISDEAIKVLMENLKVTFHITRCTERLPQPAMFRKDDAEMLQIRDFRFSLPGLLKHVESAGYGYGLGYPEDSVLAEQSSAAGKYGFEQPVGLKVDLYEFQKSTYRWMMDQEKDEGGLNGYFWEEWQLEDGGGSLYYFPLGGEFRFDRPPTARGGLLCEEMGLGKTIEVLALILGNPASPASLVLEPKNVTPLPKPFKKNAPKKSQKIPIRGTLIVAPLTLIPQWWDEILKRTTCGMDRGSSQIRALNLGRPGISSRDYVPSCDVRELLFDAHHNIIGRTEWGQFSDGSVEVEVRSLPYVTDGILVRGTMSLNHCRTEINAEAAKDQCGINRNHFIGKDASYKLSCVAVFMQFDENIQDADIVLTTYKCLQRKDFKLFMKLQWHRIVLDECQEIKIATNDIAKMCASLSSERRWMVSGTPLCSKVSDLHGELNFLKVWPFCLSNSVDGFWDLRVETPWKNQDESALTMLYALVDVVMIRHCKSQKYVSNGAPLVTLPNRTVEWRGFKQDMQSRRWGYQYSSLNGFNDTAMYAYQYLECFAADAVGRFLQRNNLSGDDTSHQQWMAAPHASHLKGIYAILSRCLTHPRAVSLQHVDHLKRMLGDVTHIVQGKGRDRTSVPILSPDDILNIVQGINMDGGGGAVFNRESSRVQASVSAHEAEEQQRNTLMAMSVAELSSQLQEFELPQPISWLTLQHSVSVDQNSPTVTFYQPLAKTVVSKGNDLHSADEDDLCENEGDAMSSSITQPRKSLHDSLMVGDVIRLSKAKSEDNELTVARVFDHISDPHHNWGPASVDELSMKKNGETSSQLHRRVVGEIEASECWSLENQRMVPVYKRSYSTRKAAYVNLLVANAQALNLRQLYAKNGSDESDRSNARSTEVEQGMLHAGGFSTIYKLMAGLIPSCPLCLGECTRPTVTKCMHVFCFECIASVIDRENFIAKCPICRRTVQYKSLMEVKESNEVEESPTEGMDEAMEVEEEEEEEEEEECDTVSRGRITRRQLRNSTKSGGSSSSNSSSSSSSSSSGSSTSSRGSSSSSRDNRSSNSLRSSSSDITFVIPPLDASTTAVATKSLEKLEDDSLRRFHRYSGTTRLERATHLPSISPYALSVFEGGSRNGLDMSPRLREVLKDIKEVQKNDPFSKFVVFSQYKESLQMAHQVMSDERVFEECELSQPLQCVLLGADGLSQFYTNPTCNVLFLTLGAAATGLTLTMAENTIHLGAYTECCRRGASHSPDSSHWTNSSECSLYYILC